jgi:phosphoserine phosphatase
LGRVPWRLATFDVDGTLTTVHGWKVIAEATGRQRAYSESNDRFFRRQATEDEHLRDLVGLAEGLTVPDLEELLAKTPKLSGIGAGVQALRRMGVTVALLTHNPTFVCEWYARQFGFDDFEGGWSPPFERGRIPPSWPLRADKRTGLLRLLARHQLRPVDVVHVGDGWADIPVFHWTGGGVALNTDRPEVEQAATVSVRTTEFGSVLRALVQLSPRPPVNDVFVSGEPLNR